MRFGLPRVFLYKDSIFFFFFWELHISNINLTVLMEMTLTSILNGAQLQPMFAITSSTVINSVVGSDQCQIKRRQSGHLAQILRRDIISIRIAELAGWIIRAVGGQLATIAGDPAKEGGQYKGKQSQKWTSMACDTTWVSGSSNTWNQPTRISVVWTKYFLLLSSFELKKISKKIKSK